MMRTHFLLIGLIACILLSSPFWMRLDFAKFSFSVPDSFEMLPLVFWPFSVILILSLLVLTYLTSDFRYVLVVAGFVFIFFPLLQWPSVFGWDQYLHTYIANQFVNPSAVFSGYSEYGVEYPGSFVVLATFRSITGLDFITAAVFLAVFVKVSSLALFLNVSKHFLGIKYACIASVLFVLCNFRFVDYFQFSPQALALPLFLSVISLFIKPMSRILFVALVFLTSSVVVTHIFTSVFLLMTFLSIFVVRRLSPQGERSLNVETRLLITILVVWLSWQIFSANSVVKEGLGQFLNVAGEGLSFNKLLGAVLTFGRGATNTILVRYRQILLVSVLFGAFVTTGLWLRKAGKAILSLPIAMLFGTAIFGIVLTILSQPPSRIWLDRVILLGMLAPVILSVYGLSNLCRKQPIARFVIPIALVALILPSFFADYQYVYMSTIKNWELSPLSFVSTRYGKNFTITSDGITLILLRNIDLRIRTDRGFSGYTLNRFTFDPENATGERILAPSMTLRSFRQEVDWYYNQEISPATWNHFDNRLLRSDPTRLVVYDSLYEQIYVRDH